MLAGLARWLRAAGYDTALARPGTPDAALLAQCRDEGRVLVTRDRRLAREADGLPVVLLGGEDLDGHARELARALRLDWTHAPFTRCLVDNTALRPAREDERARLPPRARLLSGPFRVCPSCGRLYWPGSHVRRMGERLRRWREAGGLAGA